MASRICPLALAVGALLGVAVDLACQPCDASVCVSQARLILGEPGDAPLRAGDYVLELTVDGEAFSTTCEVTAEAKSVDCESLEKFPISAPLFDSPDNPHTQIWIDFAEPLPAAIELRVEHDGAAILESAFEFDYALSEPGCDAECRDALTELAFERT